MRNLTFTQWGYIISFSSLLILPVPMAVAGIVLGGINIKKGEKKHGSFQIVIAMICGFIGVYLGNFLYSKFI
ncbi:MAG: hypothetical protein GY817_02405 [bacterium]|nr:hypothetical protein [bacterium]